MTAELLILECAKKHGLNDADIRCIWRNAVAVRRREFKNPCHYAVAGPDLKGRLCEMLAAEQEDGRFIVYHAMKLTNKMAHELDLE